MTSPALFGGIFTPFEFEFFRNGILVATLAGTLCGILGVFVVLRGMSYIGHGLSHAVFGGAAASAVMNINYFIGAGFWGVTSGVIIGRIARRKLIGADAAIGIVTTASFAIGLVLLNKFGQAQKSIEAVLFGSVLGVHTIDIIAVAVVTLGVIVLVVALYRSFLFATFDPEVAQVSGVRVALVEALLMAMLSLTILVTMRVIGTLLISALLVIPASVARMLTNSFAKMLWIAPTVGGVSAFVGMFLAFHFDTSASATIILVGTVLFICVYAFSGIRGRSRIAGIHSH